MKNYDKIITLEQWKRNVELMEKSPYLTDGTYIIYKTKDENGETQIFATQTICTTKKPDFYKVVLYIMRAFATDTFLQIEPTDRNNMLKLKDDLFQATRGAYEMPIYKAREEEYKKMLEFLNSGRESIAEQCKRIESHLFNR